MRDIMFALTWAALIPASLLAAQVGVLLWVWTALLSPADVLIGFMASVPLNKAIAGVTFVRMFISREKLDRYFDATLKLVTLLGIAATLSWLNAIVSADANTDLYFKLMKVIALVFVISAVMTSRSRIHLLVLTVVIALGFNAVKEGAIFLLSAGGHVIAGNGSIGDNNSLATALLMIVPLTAYLIRRSAVRLVRAGLIGVLVLCLVTVVATYSRGGFVGLLVLGGFMLKNSRHKLASAGLVLAVVAVVYFTAPDTWFQRVGTLESADQDMSFMNRVSAWKISLLIALDHPFLGGGPHSVQQSAVWLAYRPFLAMVDFVTTPPAIATPMAAHSIYFEILGDLGFTGLGVFLSLLGATFWNLHKIGKMAAGHPSLAWAVDLARMLQISMVIYMVTGAALSMGYFEMAYVLIAIVSRTRRTVLLSLAAMNADQAVLAAAPNKLQQTQLVRPGFGYADAPIGARLDGAAPHPGHAR